VAANIWLVGISEQIHFCPKTCQSNKNTILFDHCVISTHLTSQDRCMTSEKQVVSKILERIHILPSIVEYKHDLKEPAVLSLKPQIHVKRKRSLNKWPNHLEMSLTYPVQSLFYIETESQGADLKDEK
jgi:hypothetical protein